MASQGRGSGLLALPIELQIEVIIWLQCDPGALRVFALTCKHIRTLADPYLWGTVNLSFPLCERIPKLYIPLLEEPKGQWGRRRREIRSIHVCGFIPPATERDNKPLHEYLDQNCVKLDTIPRIEAAGNFPDSHINTIRAKWIETAITIMIEDLPEQQIEEFSWTSDVDMWTENEDSLLNHLIKRHSKIHSLRFRLTSASSIPGLMRKLENFTNLTSLDLNLRFYDRAFPGLINVLEKVQATLSRFCFNLYDFFNDIGMYLDYRWRDWQDNHPGQSIRLKKLTSFGLMTNIEIPVLFVNYGWIKPEQVKSLDVVLRGRLTARMFCGCRATEAPKNSELKVIFRGIQKLSIQLRQFSGYQFYNIYGELPISTLERCISQLDGLEELVLTNLNEEFNLSCLDRFVNSLKKVELNVEPKRLLYRFRDAENWYSKFPKLDPFSIKKYSEVFVNSEGRKLLRISNEAFREQRIYS
ncbi:hypothetical protein H072_5433 [Dactylellina haptotyla CBS 200.50]|uniref:F-box domain-containing protein n=1 Tax=Dactylellina haptotyla (strain CBS 200.50) TaxID=1284197 RepID=S8ACK8_DACHA|nr:hypothetical protein H072_5433 [Dactylellina haptotyla CBS 200.50]